MRKMLQRKLLTGEEEGFRNKKALESYYRKQVLTGLEEKPDFEKYDMIRENESSGVNSIQSTTNLVI